MANFNPAVPQTNDPNWLGWSKSITQPQGDTSAGEALSMAGGMIKDTLNATDTLFKLDAKNTAYDAARQVQDEYTSSLEKADISTRVAASAAQGPGTPTTLSNASSSKAVYDEGPRNILAPTQGEDLPNTLQKLPGNIEALDGARANGKLSETAYYGRLNTLAKDLRSRYPGYREYIDDEIQKVTGVNPANKYISSLLGDINTFVTSGKEIDTKIRNELWTNLGQPGVPAIMAAYNAGQFGTGREAEARIMAALAPTKVLKSQLEQAKAIREEQKGQREDVAASTENEANLVLRMNSVTAFNTLHLMSGAPTAQQISQIITDAAAGKIQLSDEQAQVLSRNIRSLQYQANKSADDYFNTVGRDGRTVNTILGDKVDALKKRHGQQFEDVAKLIEDKEFGAAYHAMNTIRAMGDQDQLTLLTVPELGQNLRLGNAIAKMNNDQATKAVLQENLSQGMLPKFQEFAKRAQGLMATQPNTPNGVVETVKKQVDDLDRRVNAPGAPAVSKIEVAKTYDSILRNIDSIPKITNPTIRENLARAAFDPSNLGLLTKFEEDHYKDGRFIPGKFKVFNGIFNEEMTKTVKTMPAEIQAQYKDLAKQMWGRELFGNFLNRFSNAAFDDLQGSNAVKIAWDSDNYKFKPPVFSGNVSVASQNYLKQNFERINNSFATVAALAKADGQDPNVYILNWMKEFGVDTGKLPGVPAHMFNAVITSKEADKKSGDSFDKRFGAPAPKVEPKVAPRAVESPENKINPMTGKPFTAPSILNNRLPYNEEQTPPSGSLSGFLKNPVGTFLPPTRNNAPVTAVARPRGNLTREELLSISTEGDNADAFKKINPNY